MDLNSYEDCEGEILTEFVNANSANLSVFISGNEVSSVVNYQWNTGQNQPVIYVENEGLYCVQVTLENGCFFETCTYFSTDGQAVDDGLVITYYDEISQYGQKAEIELYKVEGEGAYLYEVVQEWPLLNIQGLFYTNNMDDGTYFARAKPVESDIFIPSYSSKSPFWDESKHFSIDNGGKGLKSVINVFAIPISNVSGVGKIGGWSWSYGESDNIMLFYNSVPVGQKYTDYNGQFLFSSLPYGTYTVVRERPGMPRDEVVVTISAEFPVISDVSFNEVTASKDVNLSANIHVYPNPSSNIISIDSKAFDNDNFTVTIYNLEGKEISKYKDQSPVNNKISVDINFIDNGIYFMKIESEKDYKNEKNYKNIISY